MRNQTINRAELKGRIGTVRICSINDRLVANFSLATERHYTDTSTNNVVEVTWHHVVVWEGKGINLGGLSRGVLVHVKGHLRNSKYTDAQGCERVFTELVANSLDITNENAIKDD